MCVVSYCVMRPHDATEMSVCVSVYVHMCSHHTNRHAYTSHAKYGKQQDRPQIECVSLIAVYPSDNFKSGHPSAVMLLCVGCAMNTHRHKHAHTHTHTQIHRANRRCGLSSLGRLICSVHNVKCEFSFAEHIEFRARIGEVLI